MNLNHLSRTYVTSSLLLIFLLCFFGAAIAQPGNNACGSATPLTPGTTCTSTAGTLRNGGGSATSTAGISAFCGNANSPDVWYSFVATSAFPTVRLSSMGTQMDNSPRLQIFNTTSCVSGTLNVNSYGCASGAGEPTLNLVPTNALTVGTTYLVRVFTNGNSVAAGSAADWNFNICVINAPVSDLCANPIILTSSTSCVNTAGNVYTAGTSTTTISAPDCATGVTRDVWYRFVAQTTNPTITLSSIGANFQNPNMQLLSNSCGGTFTPLFCGTTSIAADFLTPGTTYLIRVYSTSATVPASTVGAGFNICVVDPVTPPPGNDECAGAVNLSVGSACSNLNTDMAGATASAVPLGGTCAVPNAYDVWYKFTALGANETITLSGFGANFLTPQIELLSGNCGALTSVSCGASPLVAAGLTPGNTYYVRIYSTTAPPPNGNARFNICVQSSDLPVVRFGNSYVNITKKTTGGVVEPGDILEIRMTIHHSSATSMSGLRFLDNIPSNTTIYTGAGDFIKVITNEGLTYKQYTQTAADDAATYLAAPPVGQFNIRMNLGFGASNPGIPANNTATEFASATGTMANTNNPRGGGGLLFATAYRVVVTGAVGDTITLSPSRFIYRTGGSDVTLTGSSYQILISDPLTLCTNSIGVNNAAEYGGTFGSGATLNRTTDLTVPISGYSFMSNISAYNSLGDGRYAIVKNMSPRSSNNRYANRRNNCGSLAFDHPDNCSNRMHGGFWYIDGDHTGTNNAIGNVPPDEATSSGYMLMVNADYVASEVYNQTINNLCPDTYYEFSGWFRNICPTCGVDSVGAQFTGTPTAPLTGYPGVYPNLSFSLNGLDYYSTGEIDTLGWLKKGFVFRTGPAQTAATFAIRNNSQGGGGNDWVMDDISVATCTPNLNLVPNGNSQVCYGNQVDLNCDVISYFDNYVYHQWQISRDSGATWSDTLAMGVGSPAPSGGSYVYNAPFPSFVADSGQHMVQYRIRVASSPANLYSGCSFYNSANIIVMVNNCLWVLKADLLSFKAAANNKQAILKWQTREETALTTFEIQKSYNGTQFFTIGTVQGFENKNSYSFTDPEALSNFAYYRIIVKEKDAQRISKTEFLTVSDAPYGIISVVNPFYDVLSFSMTSAQSTNATIIISDAHGKTLRSFKQPLVKGFNELQVRDLGSLTSGTYVLQVITNDGMKSKRIVKLSK